MRPAAFSNERVGQNYPWIFPSHGVGSIAFPIIGGKLDDLDVALDHALFPEHYRRVGRK
ncbi:MAG: hypothetical protein GY945_02080 [Rhodobacteraceae bacterium]|nr:hypothetical protein [Paracoccaceae bacterium]